MKLADLNVLLYAANRDSTHHESSHRWLSRALNGGDSVGFAWVVTTGFIRISTRPGLFPTPLTTAQALETVGRWVAAPGARILEPASDHLTVMERLLSDVGVGGNLVTDAHLAALAIEHRATVVSYDADFGRFSGVRWSTPDDLL